MNKLLVLLFVTNIIVLTSCSLQQTTTVEKATATAQATSNGDNGGSSASASTTVKKTVTTTTGQGPNNSNNGCDDDDDNNDGDQINYSFSECEDCNGSLTTMKDSANKLSFQALCYLMENGENNKMATDALTVFYQICQLALYTFGQTRDELLKFCGVKSKEEIRCGLQIMGSFSENQPKGVEFRFCPNTLSDYNNIFTQPFIRDVRKLNGGYALNYDLGKTAPEIVNMKNNNVIAKETNNRVRNAITNSSIFTGDPNASKLVFASGKYFMSLWQVQFDITNVTMRRWVDMDNKVYNVPFVYQCNVFNFTMNKKFDVEAVSIPFVEEYFNSVVIMPKSRCPRKLRQLVDKLTERGAFGELLAGMAPAVVEFIAPYFGNISTEVDTVEILKQTHEIDSIFNPETANIENAYDEKLNVYLADGRSRTIIKNTLRGVKPPCLECPEVLNGMEKRTFLADRPVIIVVENHSLIRSIAVGVVQKDY